MWIIAISAVIYLLVGFSFIVVYKKSNKVERVRGNEKLFYLFVLVFWLPYAIYAKWFK